MKQQSKNNCFANTYSSQSASGTSAIGSHTLKRMFQSSNFSEELGKGFVNEHVTPCFQFQRRILNDSELKLDLLQ